MKAVRFLAIAVAGAVALTPAGARADQREDLQKKGEQQAKDGRFAEAIDSFKAADRIQPRASHACLIALAYTRRELWSQAQLWMATCHERATQADPLPDWVPLAEGQIRDRLTTANVAEVTIEVKPAGTQAKFTVSSFAPDEVFEPRTITLPYGTHVIFAKRDDGAQKQHTLQITNKTPQRVVIEFDAGTVDTGGSGDVVAPLPPGPDKPRGPDNNLSNALLIGGGVALILGGASHIVMAKARGEMSDATSMFQAGQMTPADFSDATSQYQDAEKRFERWRTAAIGLYVVGAGAMITGYLVRKHHNPEAAAISAAPLPEGGAFVSVGWAR